MGQSIGIRIKFICLSLFCTAQEYTEKDKMTRAALSVSSPRIPFAPSALCLALVKLWEGLNGAHVAEIQHNFFQI